MEQPRRRPGRKADEHAKRSRSSLKPWFTHARAVVKYYKRNSDSVQKLEEDANL